MSEQAYSVVGYVRVSTGEQADSGAGLEAQRQAIASEAERKGWQLVHVYEDSHASGKSLNGRPGLSEARAAVERGEAEGLVVSKLDRLSRSLWDHGHFLEGSPTVAYALKHPRGVRHLSEPLDDFVSCGHDKDVTTVHQKGLPSR